MAIRSWLFRICHRNSKRRPLTVQRSQNIVSVPSPGSLCVGKLDRATTDETKMVDSWSDGKESGNTIAIRNIKSLNAGVGDLRHSERNRVRGQCNVVKSRKETTV